MSVGIFIAVRMKSQRLPKKAIEIIGGQTVIEHLIDRLKLAKKVDEIILCTSTHPDDEILTKIADRKGLKWFKGEEDDVLKRFIDCAEKEGLDAVVRVTGDNILTDPEIIDSLIESHLQTAADYTTMDNLPLGVTAEVAWLRVLKRAHQIAKDPENTEYMTNYLRDPKHFKINILQPEAALKRPAYRLTIDLPPDLELIRSIFQKLYINKRIFPLSEVIQLLDSDPYLPLINCGIIKKHLALKGEVFFKPQNW